MKNNFFDREQTKFKKVAIAFFVLFGCIVLSNILITLYLGYEDAMIFLTIAPKYGVLDVEILERQSMLWRENFLEITLLYIPIYMAVGNLIYKFYKAFV